MFSTKIRAHLRNGLGSGLVINWEKAGGCSKLYEMFTSLSRWHPLINLVNGEKHFGSKGAPGIHRRSFFRKGSHSLGTGGESGNYGGSLGERDEGQNGEGEHLNGIN